MYNLSEAEINFIARDLRLRGIVNEDLFNNLLDHVCILIETAENHPEDFETHYRNTIRRFYVRELHELEADTNTLLLRKRFLKLSRTAFFVLLLLLVLAPSIGYNLNYMIAMQATLFDIPLRVWDMEIAYSSWPLLILFVLYFTPERWEPVVPRNSVILLGFHPLIKIVR